MRKGANFTFALLLAALLVFVDSSKFQLHPTEPANYRGSFTFDLNETMYNSAFHKYPSLLVTKPLIIIGLVIIILGVVFLLQSKSSLGPSTSFMYSNPGWTVNAYIMIAMGFIVIGVGVITRQYSSKHS
jgi:hypothetical protein